MSASKFTPENRGALIERTAAGVPLADACRALDLRHATVKGWITRGRRENGGAYRDFAAAIEQARGAVRERPGPLTRAEFDLRLAEAVRGGSVQAMKLYADLYIGEEPEAESEPADEFDELRARRAARGG